MKIYKTSNNEDLEKRLTQAYNDLRNEMMEWHKKMMDSPKVPEDSALIDKDVYGPTIMLSGRVGGYEDCLDRILKVIKGQ